MFNSRLLFLIFGAYFRGTLSSYRMDYKKINNLLGWICATIATIVYVMTVERTASWWDCGEFIASAYKMQIVHQPGAPLFLMIQNLFSNLAMGDTTRIAYWMNIGSAVCSGLTILFLFWTITALARKIFVKKTSEVDVVASDTFLIMASGVVGALAYAFTDTFWFSAVESEVYAMSSLCTAVVFWAILKWEAKADEPHGDKWLVLIAYVMGLSIGVHLLNLLVIPAIALVIYFRKTKESTKSGVFKALALGIVVLGFILWGVIQYSVKIAAYFDLFFVNTLGLGFGSGLTFFIVLLVGGLIYSIYYSIKKKKYVLNIAMISTAFIILGYSSFAMIMIRAKADPTLNNSDPDNAFSFLSYLNREQYGDEPLFKGRFFDARPTGVEEGKKVYRKDGEKYVVAKRNPVYSYDRETIFPRIYSDKGGHPQYYREYLGLGPDEAPTFADNIKFFFGYQIGYMYGRYFLWNFVGRQNDQQGHGSFTEGNWISGIKPIDNMLVGGQDVLPTSVKMDPSHNTYFFLPLILGLLGAFWHFGKRQRDASVVGLLFFFTGIAIVLYLNQSPLQPRERDYAYAGSFYAFSVWIGLGVLAIADFLRKKVNVRVAGISAATLGLFAGPVILIAQNYDDHNRSEKTLARDMARNYLESCAPNAILFSYGDNDTYPLWYVQEVEGFRTDVRVVNLSLLSADWYMKQMMKKVNDAEALPINIDPELIKDGVRDVIYYQDYNVPGYVPVQDLLKVMLSDNPQNKAQLQSGELVNVLPTKKMELAVDKQAVRTNRVVPTEWESEIVDTMRWTYSQNYVSRAELSMLAILAHNNWERPIYYTITTPEVNYMGLDRYLVSEGFAYRLMPVDFGLREGDPATLENVEKTYDNIMNKFSWGNIGQAAYIDPDSYRYISMYVGSIYGQTARQLLSAGEKEKAKKLVIDAYENMPKRTFLMSEVMGYVPLLRAMYETGESMKANEVTQRNLTFLRENMAYYEAVAQTKSKLEYSNMRYGLASIQRYKQMLDEVEQPELRQQVDELFSIYRHYFEQVGE